MTLNAEEQEFLLPHFLMLLIGRPGSGKSYLIKRLVTEFYAQKFDKILLLSPSFQKIGFSLPED